MRKVLWVPLAILLFTAAAAAVVPAPATAPAGAWKPLGEYRVTGYCACVKCCGKSDGITADGTYAPGFQGRLVSAPKSFAFGTQLWVEGVGVVVVHDRGGAIKGRHIELFFQKYHDAMQWGVQERQVWIWESR
jgi:3D (Asp-Asp-Asp) domain-containing protein